MGRMMVCGGVETINFMIQTDKKENEILGHFHAIKKQYFVYITIQKMAQIQLLLIHILSY